MRRLSVREWVLLAVLLILILVSGYVLMFYMPMMERLNLLEEQIAQSEDLIFADQIKAEKQNRMQRELEEIFAAEEKPVKMADYDNIHAVMFELNRILEQTEEYSLNFSTVDMTETIVRRPISLRFCSADYTAAKEVLRQLHDSQYRCMLDHLDIGVEKRGEPKVSVSATVVFFEYRAQE